MLTHTIVDFDADGLTCSCILDLFVLMLHGVDLLDEIRCFSLDANFITYLQGAIGQFYNAHTNPGEEVGNKSDLFFVE